MDKQYKIELGVKLDTSDLKTEINKVDGKHKIKLGVDLGVDDIRKRISQYNANSNNIKVKLKATLDTDDLKKQISKLNLNGTSGNKGIAVPINTQSLEASLKDVKAIIADIKNSIGTLDSKSGMKSLLSSINQISSALEKASNQFEILNTNLNALGGKDLSLNFGINLGGSNPIARQSAYGNKARNDTLPQLKQQMNALVKYYNDVYKDTADEFSALQKLVSGTKLSTGDFFQNFMFGKDSVASRMSGGSLSSQMQAYKQYIDMFKQAASLKGLDLSSVTSGFSKSADQLIQDAQDVQTGTKEMDESFEKLKQIFGGGNNLNVEGLSQQLDSIVVDLGEIKTALQSLSSGVSLEGLTQSFDRLSDTIEKLVSNITLAKNALGDGLSNLAGGNTGSINNIEKASDAATSAVVQNEKKKQEAYKATADAVVYHAGVISKLNKAETNGRFYGSNRGTGYFGTGHYFVDAATKHELDNDRQYSKMPYTSVDISQYDNLFKATTDEVAGRLHTFLSNLTAFTQGSDEYDVSELFAQFRRVFGDTIMDVQEFGSRLDQLKTFMTNSSLNDRSDSVSTQFMKSLGYGGVDTRGTSYADTRYGTVIYDLKEESILQANITDELQKQGQMLEKINYAKGQVFDKDTDARIQSDLDAQAKRQEINDEFKKSFDTTGLDKADNDLLAAKNRLAEIDETINRVQHSLNNLDQEYKEFSREMSMLGFDDDDELLLWEDEDEWKQNHSKDYQNYINELSKEKAELQSKIPVLEETYNRESQLANEAYEKAKQTVEQRRLESQQAQESANTVVQSEERKQQEMKQTASVIDDAESVIDNLKKSLSGLGVDSSSIDIVTKDIQEMGLEITKVKSEISGNNLKLSITGIEETENGIKRIVTETKEFADIVSNPESIKRSVTDSFETSADKTKADFEELKRLVKEISSLRIDIFQSDDVADISRAETELEKLNNEYGELYAKIGRSLNDRQKSQLSKLVDQGDTKALNVFNKEVNEFIKLQKQIENTRFEIGKLEITGDSTNQISELQRELSELENTYDRLMQSFMKKISVNADIVSFNDIADKLDNGITEATRNAENRLEQFKAKWADTRAELAKNIKVNIELGNTDNEMDAMRSNLNNLLEANTDLRTSVELVEKAYEDMLRAANTSTDDEVSDRERLIQAEKEYAAALEKTNNLIKQQGRIDKKNTDKDKLDYDIKLFQSEIDSWLIKNSAATKRFGGTMLDLKAKAENVDRVTLNGLISQFKLADKEAEKLGLKTQSTFDKLKTKFKEYMTYLSAAELFMYAEQALRSMFEQVKLIDAAMTELKKVTNETDAAYEKFLTNAADRAKAIGTTIDGLVSSTADFARLGYGFEDAQGLAEVANIYAVVGDEIEGVEGATESLISTMAAFKDEMNGMSNSDFAMSIIDKFNEIGNNFAISSGGIGEALERSASSLMAANNTIDESIALITAANTVVQDPTAVGKWLADIKSGYIG